MTQLTDYGKKIRHRLVDIEQPLAWLAEQVRAKTGMFCDGGYLRKISTGERAPRKIIDAINEILEI